VLLPVDADYMEKGITTGRVKDKKGGLRKTYHTDPTMDTREYEVMSSDGAVKKYSANIIAGNFFAQIDQAGKENLLICEFIDHKTDRSVVHADDVTLTDKDGFGTHLFCSDLFTCSDLFRF